MPQPTRILAWHFGQGQILSHGDDRPVIDGHSLHVNGDIEPCVRGLHGSERAIDALMYQQGPIVSRVELFGTLVPHGDPTDKWAASDRLQLWHTDAAETLRRCATWCTVQALKAAYAQGIEPEISIMESYATDAATATDAAVRAAVVAACAAEAAACAAATDAAAARTAVAAQNTELARRLLLLAPTEGRAA